MFCPPRLLVVGVLAQGLLGGGTSVFGQSTAEVRSSTTATVAPQLVPWDGSNDNPQGASSVVRSRKTRSVRSEFTLRTTGRWQLDNGDRTQLGDRLFNPSGENFGDLVSTIGGKVTYGEVQGTLRVDAAGYVHRPVPAASASQLIRNELADRYVNTVQIEYVSVQYASRRASLTLGDYYATLGRGLILAVRKVDGVGVDNKLRGGEGRLRLGPLSLHGFGGVLNVKNFEQGTGYAFEDPNDLIAGGAGGVSGDQVSPARGSCGVHAAEGN